MFLMSVRLMPVLAADADSIPAYGRLSIGLGNDSVKCVDVGLIGIVPSLKGFQFGIAGGGVLNSMSGVGIYGLIGMTPDDVNGVKIAGFNYIGGHLRGVAIGGINIAGEGMHGLQIGAVNGSSIETKGVQLGIFNGADSGLRVGVFNMSDSGVGIGFVNMADTLLGVQIGVINNCCSNPSGTQVGIINVSEDEGRQIGLLNFNKRSRLQMLVAAGSYSPVNLALRVRNRHTYNVIGFGIGQKGWDDYLYSSAYYRIGQYLTLLPRFTVSADVGIADVAVMRKGTDAPKMFALEGRLNVEYEVHPKASLFATVGYASTRYVASGKSFRRKPFVELGVALF